MAEPTVQKFEAKVPLTVEIDLNQLLVSVVGEIPTFTGDPGEPGWEPAFMFNEIIQAAATIVAGKLMSNATEYQGLAKKLKEAIDLKLSDMVSAALDKPYVKLDTYGEPLRGAESTTLRETIKEQVAITLSKGMQPGDRYSSNSTNVNGAVKKYVDAQVLEVINKDFKEAIDKAKAEVVGKIKDKAAQVIAETIEKGVK